MFNLVRGLRREVENDSETESVLLPLKERAERTLKDLENRKTTELAAMELLVPDWKEHDVHRRRACVADSP